MASAITIQDAYNLQGANRSPPHKRKAVAFDEDAASTAKRHRENTQRAEQPNAHAQSLETAMRVEPKHRLYLSPIAWTERHLQLLGAYFDIVKKFRHQLLQGQRGLDTKGAWDSESCLRAIGNLAGSNVSIQSSAMTDLLRSLGLRTRNREPCRRIEMQFRGQPACQLKVDGVWKAKAGDRITANINFDAVSELRRKLVYRRKRGTSRDGAGLEVKRKKEKAIQPKNPHEDPYILGLLLALAQQQRKLEPEAQRWKVLLLGIPGIRARHLYCYEAWAPTQLLQKLDDPTSEMAYPSVAISIVKINIQRPQEAARGLWTLLRENSMC